MCESESEEVKEGKEEKQEKIASKILLICMDDDEVANIGCNVCENDLCKINASPPIALVVII